ncbi:MAG TPA: hypothetical protein VD978_16875 [Azospirillum sp.]|nr:hypothetical protein [Azospirillum sp.]
MRDQPLSLAEAAKWLGCTAEEVNGYIADGLLKPFQGASAAESPQVSLNSVVVLAESLPVERGVFRVRDIPSYDSAPPRPASSGYGGPGGFNKPRPAPIVERRPLRPPSRGE